MVKLNEVERAELDALFLGMCMQKVSLLERVRLFIYKIL